MLVVIAGIRPFPPLSWLVELNAFLKGAWVTTPAHEPPFGHAEELRLAVFCKKTGIPGPGGHGASEGQKGLQGVSPQVRLIDFARANHASPLEPSTP